MADRSVYLSVCLVFAVLVTPLYLLFRFLVRTVRIYYGFADPVPDENPLRICDACDNTVMEDDFVVCPYCGAPLPPPAAPAEGPS